jgi:hypothetical protein
MAENENTGLYTPEMISRREAIIRVTALLGGVGLVGGTALLTGCRDETPRKAGEEAFTPFTPEEVAYLDEVADTILPETSTPGAKAAKTGALMAVIVTDSYKPEDQKIFREGMKTLDAESRKVNGTAFVAATPKQRLALLETVDKEQKAQADARNEARKKKKEAEARLPDQRKEAAKTSDAPAAAITAEPPTHYFRMMKELALLGYFTSEIGCKQAQRYEESPGRFDPCIPYKPGEKAWAGHA